MIRENYENLSEWLEARHRSVGASDVAAILGISKYRNINDVWRDKTNKSSCFAKTYSQRYGSDAEEYIRNLFKLWFKDELLVTHTPNEIIRMNDKPYQSCSLDGEFIAVKDISTTMANGLCFIPLSAQGTLEIKTADVSKIENAIKWDNGNVPDEYLVQVLHQLNVTGYDYSILVALKEETRGGYTRRWFDLYFFSRYDYLEEINQIEDNIDSFWEDYVLTGTEPDFTIKIKGEKE